MANKTGTKDSTLAMAYMDLYVRENKTVQEIANQFGLKVRYLQKLKSQYDWDGVKAGLSPDPGEIKWRKKNLQRANNWRKLRKTLMQYVDFKWGAVETPADMNYAFFMDDFTKVVTALDKIDRAERREDGQDDKMNKKSTQSGGELPDLTLNQFNQFNSSYKTTDEDPRLLPESSS